MGCPSLVLGHRTRACTEKQLLFHTANARKVRPDLIDVGSADFERGLFVQQAANVIVLAMKIFKDVILALFAAIAAV
jgi:hypothetical protein